jgi:hypothetical protein
MQERLSPEELYARKLMEQYEKGTTADKCAPWLLLLMYALLITLALCCFSSCRVLDKHKSKRSYSTDSSAQVSNKFSQVQRLDSGTKLFKKDTGTIQSVHNYTRETTTKEYFPTSQNGLLYFDMKLNTFRSFQKGVWIDTILTGEAAIDFWRLAHAYRETTTKESGIKTELQTGSSTMDQSLDLHKSDTSSYDQQANTQLSKDSKDEKKDTKTRGWHWSVYVFGILLLLGIAANLYIRKKAKQLEDITNIFSQ